MQADIYLQMVHKVGSGVQERILNNQGFIDYMLDLYTIFKGNHSDSKRKI